MSNPPQPPASPCVRNCCLDSNDICIGCFRSLDEILEWGSASIEEQLAILKKAEQRKQNTNKQ